MKINNINGQINEHQIEEQFKKLSEYQSHIVYIPQSMPKSTHLSTKNVRLLLKNMFECLFSISPKHPLDLSMSHLITRDS